MESQEEAPEESSEPASDENEEPAVKDSSTQTPGLNSRFGWDHHHTRVREVRPNGTIVTTEDFIWRVGHGSVRFPCCDGPAESFMPK